MVHVREECCSGCGLCMESCPQEAIQLREGRAWVDATLCNGCGACVEVCPNGAIAPVREEVRASLAPAAQGGSGATSSAEIVAVQAPPPPEVASPMPSRSRGILPAVGAALASLGREIGPWLARLASEALEARRAGRGTGLPARGARGGRAGAGRRHRRRGRF